MGAVECPLEVFSSCKSDQSIQGSRQSLKSLKNSKRKVACSAGSEDTGYIPQTRWLVILYWHSVVYSLL